MTAIDAAEERAVAALRARVGTPMGEPTVSPDPVNQPMIRHWAAAFEDHNPVYTDAEFAAASRFGGIVSPPLMLQTWTMPTPLISGIAQRGGSPVEGVDNPLDALDEAGFIATVATNSEFEFVRYLRLGEMVTAENSIEEVSERKQTRLGAGYFVTWGTVYRTADGEVVGRQKFRILKFKPDLEALAK